MRIALIHGSDVGGGAEQCVMSLHRTLLELGHDSTLFVGHRQSDAPQVVEIPYVRGMPGSRRLARLAEASLGLQDIYNPSFRALPELLRDRFDVINAHTLWGSGNYADIGALPELAQAAPTVVTLHDSWMLSGHCACFHDCDRWKIGCGECPDLRLMPPIPRDGTRLNWARKKRVLSAARPHVVAVSRWLGERAKESPALAQCSVSHIYNGIDLDVFTPASSTLRRATREAFGFAPADVVVLLAGQTVEGIREGIATKYAVAVLNRLQARGGVHALVIGRSAERVAGELKLPATVLPYQAVPQDLARCYQVADISLITSEVETFGRIGAESQACGTPVVAFDTGGIPEVVVNEVGGLVVPRRNTEALTQALARMLGDVALRRRLAAGGQAHVQANFDQLNVASSYLDLYRKVARRDNASVA